MPKYKPYMHIQRFGNREVEGIEHGTCHIFPKLDGTNSSIWMEDGEIQAGSRTRHLSLDHDNAGFLAWAQKQQASIGNYLRSHPTHRLYGEWLVPHTLKTYRQDAWRRFWIYDVTVQAGCGTPDSWEKFLAFEQYEPLLRHHGLDYITPICTIENASEEYLTGLLDKATFLVEDGRGHGEGIVIKNYDFYNQAGDQIWAKVVRQEFKEKNLVEFGTPTIGLATPVEKLAVEKFLTSSMIDKVVAKIEVDTGGWTSKSIPRLLETCFYDLVSEEMWGILKEFKNPTIDFKSLKAYTIKHIKSTKKELFS